MYRKAIKENKKKLAIIFIVVIGILVLMSNIYLRYTKNLLMQETEDHLMEVTMQSANVIANKINGDLNILRGVAIGLSNTEVLSEEESDKILNIIKENDQYLRLANVDLLGNKIHGDEDYPNVFDEIAFKDTIRGIDKISDPFKDKINGVEIITYSTPIVKNNNVESVLMGSKQVMELEEALSISLFNNKGNSYIVKNNGDVILNSNKSEKYKDFNNIFYALHNENSEKSLDEMKKQMKNFEKGVKGLYYDGEYEYVGYSPIRGINDWYVISVIPYNVVSKKANEIMTATAGLSFLMVCIIGYIMLIKIKNEMKIKELAFTDKLTGIRNINSFKRDAEEALKNSRRNLAVIQVDIDKFKLINDSLGYEKGDSLLKYVADTLQRCIPNDIFCRVSNDNFAVLLEYDDIAYIISKMKEINNEIQNFYLIKSIKYNIVISSGVYLIGDRKEEIETILDKANLAKDTVKGNHKSDYSFYDEALRDTLLEEKYIENNMYGALEKQEFQVYLQPKYTLEDKNIGGAEALVRWKHEGSMIYPNKFIPLFEKNGFIIHLDMYVFEQVCYTIKRWLDNGINPIPISVNVSRVHLNNPNFIDKFKKIVEKYQVPASLIELELTENTVLDNVDMLINIMNKLKTIGFKLSMDDFGSGYSSLNLLKEIPIDVLKIDKEFFNSKEVERTEIVINNVIKMARELNILVVAEGVEKEEQVETLTHMKCNMAQGFFFAKPMPIEEFEKLIKG